MDNPSADAEQGSTPLAPATVNWSTWGIGAALIGIGGAVGGVVGSWLAGLLAALSAATVYLIVAEWRFRRHLQKLHGEARGLLEEDATASTRSRPGETLAALLLMQTPLQEQLAREQNLLRSEAQRRVRAQDDLRETEERYMIAVSGANDGMWEWSVGSGSAYFSPRWKSMLGYDESEIGERIDEWHSRIHPEDRDHALAELQAHVDGHTPRFEHEHRLRHKDGGWRWVLTRAAAVRHASGRAYRVVGLNLDISARRQAQEVLIELADGLHGLRGERAYIALVQKFSTILDTREAFLCECCEPQSTRVRVLAHWFSGELLPCGEFDVSGTPCQEVIITGKTVFVASGVGERWPRERSAGVESYLGLPCFDTKGMVIGHLACRDRKPMEGELPHDAVLRLFAARASVEMERDALERLYVAQSVPPPPSALQ
jgi:PAS domain S-box-containing protein